MQGWVDWAASLGGQRALLAPAILTLGALAIGLLPAATGAVADALGRELRRPELVLLAPACLAFLRWPGLSEPLAAVLVLVGLARWLRDDRGWALALFTVAALTRETSLLVPVGIGLSIAWSTRRLRPALPLAVPAIAYAAWAVVVRIRVGAFPAGSAQMGLPVQGLVQAIPHWGLPEVATFLALAACSWLTWRSRNLVLRNIVVAHLAFLAFLGPLVWWFWWGFGRVTLPLFLLALVGTRTADAESAVSSEADAEQHPLHPAR
ncbi:hypothetical protein KSP35_15345 [Aquihabitans sp. G128]|uniref:hypothetical protein n=1 Tax=Aquihabitans sp. G128 TaxID=2849779 RepID=UPI001C22F223|nr:hypothetical protein [Aquihabitans sp. G128]QXC59747.1 hypothetical protein KSP35_15345 [Aquihabitans sp. G128]